MAYTTVNKSTDHFNTVTYTGNGSAGNGITGVGFQPDWVWIKRRESASHNVVDVVRGAQNVIFPDDTSAQGTLSNNLTAFGTDGFTLGNGSLVNANAGTYVAWNWKTQNAQGSSNTDGSINTTYTSVNTTSGFSISTYTGTGSNATIGHGLGVAPKWIFVKMLNATQSWINYHNGIGATKYLHLNGTDAAVTNSTIWNDTEPTASVFSVGTASNCNGSGNTYVAYCFAEKTGFSKMGSYTGTGAKNFVYTGFKPAWLMVKKTSGTDAWVMVDNKRNTSNPTSNYLLANSNAAEASGLTYDFLSNGFAFNDSSQNTSSASYIYMAFAEQPLVGSNNIPATAR